MVVQIYGEGENSQLDKGKNMTKNFVSCTFDLGIRIYILSMRWLENKFQKMIKCKSTFPPSILLFFSCIHLLRCTLCYAID